MLQQQQTLEQSRERHEDQSLVPIIEAGGEESLPAPCGSESRDKAGNGEGKRQDFRLSAGGIGRTTRQQDTMNTIQQSRTTKRRIAKCEPASKRLGSIAALPRRSLTAWATRRQSAACRQRRSRASPACGNGLG